MPRTIEDVENYLLEMNRHFENKNGTYLVSTNQGPPVALRLDPPILALRVDIGSIPSDKETQLKFFKRLLEFNTTDLMHCSYGISNNSVVISAALPIENLDRNELDAALSDIDLALLRHIPELKQITSAS